jgi:hypothetical protein
VLGTIFHHPWTAAGAAAPLQPGASHGSLTPDGRHLLFRPARTGPAGNNLWYRALEGDTTSRPLSVSREGRARKSPSFRRTAAGWPSPPTNRGAGRSTFSPSRAGCAAPRHRGGRRLPGLGSGRALAVLQRRRRDVPGGGHHRSGVLRPAHPPLRLSGAIRIQPLLPHWDLAPDGSHCLVRRGVGVGRAEEHRVIVVHNWGAELRARIREGGGR